MFYSEILIKFGYKYDKNVIHKGEYCYKLDDDKNKNRKDLPVLYIKRRPYYKTIGKVLNECKFFGIICDDIIFDDQCKMFDVNFDE